MKCLQVNKTDNALFAKHHHKTNFYLGNHYLSLGKGQCNSIVHADGNNMNDFVGCRNALLELALSGWKQDDLSESDQQSLTEVFRSHRPGG